MNKMPGFLLLCISLSVAQCVVHKTRRVVEFTMDDYHPGGEPIQTLEGLTRNKCMSSCVRIGNCSAFNFRSEDGMCMLHPVYTMTECMAENFTEGLEYVHMTNTPNGVTPWQGVRTKEYHKQWKVNPATRTGIPYVKSDMNAKRHVARVVYKGLYLPGYTERFNRRFKMVTPDGIRHTFEQCRRMVQYLVFKNSSYFKWEVFYAHWAIPSNAVIGGYWPDGTPLYIASATRAKGFRYPVYLHAHNRKTYPQVDTQEPKLCILLDMLTHPSEPARDRC